jgi:multiple sugar transport system permease protein
MFWDSLRLTMVWTGGSLMLIVPLGVLVAMLLNQGIAGTRFLRHWLLLPWMFPIVVIILMWRWILDASSGVANQMLLDVGLISRNVSFLDASKAMGTVIVVNSWRWIPFMAIVLLAALQTVPKDTVEASAVDGATSRQRFRYIIFPHILPTLSVTTFMLAMWLFNMFPPIWLMTQGGPAGSTTTLPVAIFVEGFQVFRQSVGAALSVTLLLLLAAITAIYFKFSKQRLGGV